MTVTLTYVTTAHSRLDTLYGDHHAQAQNEESNATRGITTKSKT